jgi:hypothetical protein
MATYMPRLDKACSSDLLTLTNYDERRDLVPHISTMPCVLAFPQVLRTAWWWPLCRAETCSCSYLMCFDWVCIYIYIYITYIYIYIYTLYALYYCKNISSVSSWRGEKYRHPQSNYSWEFKRCLERHHHTSVMELSHLLTRSGLTYLEVSSKVCHDSFCQLGNSITLPWVICEAFNILCP